MASIRLQIGVPLVGARLVLTTNSFWRTSPSIYDQPLETPRPFARRDTNHADMQALRDNGTQLHLRRNRFTTCANVAARTRYTCTPMLVKIVLILSFWIKVMIPFK